MMQYLTDPLTKDIFNIKGRSSRKAYWMFLVLASVIVGSLTGLIVVLLSLINSVLAIIFFGIVIFYILIASFTMAIRRCHDINYSFWYMFIPLFNIYLSILFYFVRGTEGPNTYGEDPTNLPTGTNNPEVMSTPVSSNTTPTA